ncbi:hypothetical protein BASA62_000635 [Batrachochytrium salamandrivorans]|nr:hypothetical protein BASA62_000635 [Batrachochytrium salamandrivorans]
MLANVDSSIEAFFTAPVGTKINIGINVALDTEPGCDFLYLSVKSSGGVEDFLLRSKSRDGTKTFNGISGRKMIVRETIPFTTKSKSFLFLSVNSFSFCSRIFSAVVMGKAYYGLELVGGVWTSTGHRIQSGLVPAIQKSRLRLLGRSTRSGCEECIYLAPRWSLKWRSRSGPVVGWTGLWSMNLWGRGMIIGRWQHG